MSSDNRTMSLLTQHLTDIAPLNIRKRQPVSELTLCPPRRLVTRARSFDGPRSGSPSPIKQGGPKGPRDINKPRETAKADVTREPKTSTFNERITAISAEVQQATIDQKESKPRPISTFQIEFGEPAPPTPRISKQHRKAVPTQDQVDTANYLNEHLIGAQLTSIRKEKDALKARITAQMEAIGRVPGSQVRYDTAHVKVRHWFAVDQLEQELRLLREKEAKCIFLRQYFAGVVGNARRAEMRRYENDNTQ